VNTTLWDLDGSVPAAAHFGAVTFLLAKRGRERLYFGHKARPKRPGAPTERCIFSESLNESTLHDSPGVLPGSKAGPDKGRVPFSLLLNVTGFASAALRGVVDDFVTTVFPSDCRVCNQPLLSAAQLPICERCRLAVPPQSMAQCRCCGEALEIDMERDRFAGPAEGLLCFTCRAVPPMFERAVAYAVYEDEVREMIHLLKYEHMDGVAKILGARLAEAILTLQAEAAKEMVVVAVPLFPGKQRQRGYNQAELLADEAIVALQQMAPEWRLQRVAGLLERRRDTQSQFELNPTARRRNLQGAFGVNTSRLTPGCDVLLVDDIYTTGATARECARVLRRAGASKVWVATLARAQTPHVAMWDGSRPAVAQGFG